MYETSKLNLKSIEKKHLIIKIKKKVLFKIKDLNIYIKYLINIKILFLLLFLISNIKMNHFKINKNLLLKKKLININGTIHIKHIKFGIFINSLINGGRERITALLMNYLSKHKIFELYLFYLTNKKLKNSNEYKIPKTVKRIKINGIGENKTKDLKFKLLQNKIDVFVYNYYNIKEIHMLNNLKKVKTIFYNHSCFLFWIYFNKIVFIKYLYNAYKNSKYIISLIPFENDFLFKKWNINSILMNNFLTYKYEDIIPSNLSSKIIIMIGRGYDKLKRFNLGIEAMKFITIEIPDCEMKIISERFRLKALYDLVDKLYLKNKVKFVGFTIKPEIYYKNASLHIFTSIIECFPMSLSETKVYGIPNIVTGIDYISAAKGGIIVIYDDKPETIAKESIKILKNETYRNKLGRDARESMKKFKNEITLEKWINLIIAVYKGDYYYNQLINNEKKISKDIAINNINNQINLIKMRFQYKKELSLNDIINFKFIDKLNSNIRIK